MLDQLASHGLFDVHVRATGDIHIDDHHTNEDVALAIGSLQEEAVITLQCLGKFGDGAFEDIFTTNVDFSSKYDHYIRLNLKGSKEVYSSGFCLDDECWRLYEKQVHDLLSQDPVSFFPNLLGTFEVLERRLRSIEDVPLKISHVQPLDTVANQVATSVKCD
ncbi:unnamed protein product [Linum tenue]|uniref:imidazoleglycerol-phosphate dehydratase n=1 Tax=Linum tenue TaxID=586396 RepID=A0AAV0LEB5_9ROSI|nr:unnamed protein product [Linum tenue]